MFFYLQNDLSDIPTVGPEIEDNTNLEFIEIEDNTNLDPTNLYLSPIASTSTARDEKSDHLCILISKNLPGSGKKRLTITRKLENSQKISAEMLKKMEGRNAVMDDYYIKKVHNFNTYKSIIKRIEILQKK